MKMHNIEVLKIFKRELINSQNNINPSELLTYEQLIINQWELLPNMGSYYIKVRILAGILTMVCRWDHNNWIIRSYLCLVDNL